MQVSNGRQRCTDNAAVCACPLFMAPKNFVYTKDLIVKNPPVSVFMSAWRQCVLAVGITKYSG